jgi:hypothetical protein
MTPQPSRPPLSARRPRLRFECHAAAGRYVDGAWWPHGNDLSIELPDLLASLASRLGPIYRVIYHLDDWTPTPPTLVTKNWRVRLDGYRHRQTHTLDVLGLNGAKIVLLVVSPDTNTTEPRPRMPTVAEVSVAPTLTGRHRDGAGYPEKVTVQQYWHAEGENSLTTHNYGHIHPLAPVRQA